MKSIQDYSLPITELEYRNIPDISYSLLSSVYRNGYKSLTEEFTPNISTIFGVLTESLLFGSYDKNDYYILPDDISITDKVKGAADIIFPYLLNNGLTNDDLSVYEREIVSLFENVDIDYYKNRTSESRANTIINEISGYWKHFVKSIGKIVISQETLDRATKTVETLRNHQFTFDIFNINPFQNVEKISQFKYRYLLHGHEIKVMLDWLVIDHDNKIIKPYDLKTGSKLVEDFEQSFFYWRYDIQAFLYSIAVRQLADKYYPDYTIEPFKFVYISRFDSFKPLVWKITNKLIRGAYKGYLRDGKYYKGVLELISEYNWYVENQDNVYYSKDVYDNSGELSINSDITINERENKHKSE